MPVCWFIDLEGNIVSSPDTSANGMIYPGKKVNAGGMVGASYNTIEDIFLLYWTKSNSLDFTQIGYIDNYYRMMDTEGNLLKKTKKLPKKTPFQGQARFRFDSSKNRFFGVFPEYKIFFEPLIGFSSTRETEKYLYGGTLWGVYIDNKGRIVKEDKKRIQLTNTLNDPDKGMTLSGFAHNQTNNEFLVAYSVEKSTQPVIKIYGLIH
jgi:hypothetical protein